MAQRLFIYLFLFFCSILTFAGANAKAVDDYIEGIVLRGENARSILTQYMASEDFYKMYSATKHIYDLSRIVEDYTYEIVTNEEEGLKIFAYQFSRNKKLVVRVNGGNYKAEIKSADYDIIKGRVVKQSDDVVADLAKKSSESSSHTKISDTDLDEKNKRNLSNSDNKKSEGKVKFINLSAKPFENPTEQSDKSRQIENATREAGRRANLKNDKSVSVNAKTDSSLTNQNSSDNSFAKATPAQKSPRKTVQKGSEENSKFSDPEIKIEGRIKKGEFAHSIFENCMDKSEFNKVFFQCRKTYDLTKLLFGHPYSLTYKKKSGFISFEYSIDQGKTLYVTKNSSTGKYEAKITTASSDVRLSLVKGTITSSLFKAVIDQGERAELAVMMAEIFKSEINFLRDIRKMDTFSIAVEKYYLGKKFQRYGRILAVRFVNRGKKYEGYLFPCRSDSDTEKYYNEDGESLSKSMLKMPLKFSKISSHFSLGRKHPIFKDVRKHEGVDYAAPDGTPVSSVSNGKVTKVGWGRGYGKMIVIEHDGGLESQYAHLARYAKNLNVGNYVKQGQVIGYVGSTGWATGPHLDFRLRKNGKFINPERVVTTRGDPIPKSDMRKFAEQKKFTQSVLDGKFKRSQYKPGMIHLSGK